MYNLPLAETKQHYDNRLGEWLTFGQDNQFVLFYGLHGDEQGALFDQHKEPLSYFDLEMFVIDHTKTFPDKVFITPCFPALVDNQPHPDWIKVLGDWTWVTCVEAWDNTLHIFGYAYEEYLMDKISDLYQSVERGELSEEDALDTQQDFCDTFHPENLDELEEIPLLDYTMGNYEREEDY